MTPTKEIQMDMFGKMLMARYFDEQIKLVYMEGKKPVFNLANGPIPGEMHLANGQEPCAVGVCAHLEPKDLVTAPHRPHHIAIAKGVNLSDMTAEIFGKKAGLSGGRGGHMHLFDKRVNFFCTGIVAEGIPPAVGAALAFKMKREKKVAIAFIGEGAANQGAFHEAMNLAGLWNLPFICVIEDNAWGVSVFKSSSTSVPRNDIRAAGYNMPGVYIEGNDPYAIYEAAGIAIERARSGGGPSLIEIETYRYEGHFMGDVEGYRPDGEKERLFELDPIPLMRKRLLNEKTSSEYELDELEANVRMQVDEAIAYARKCEDPAPEEALEFVFA